MTNPANVPEIIVGKVYELEIKPISQGEIDAASRLFRDNNPVHPKGVVQEALLQGVIAGAIYGWIDGSSLRARHIVKQETHGVYPSKNRTVFRNTAVQLKAKVVELEPGQVKIEFEVCRPADGLVLYCGWVRGSAATV